ncbi:NADP-dependent isocitrate dehydrogenase [Flavobacteriaceae bacterium]|nr:NADP-dependent isocitrate dehydrogenase [Flavobacteriaceae bacterium]
MKKIYYTLTDEAPALATFSFLPMVKAITKSTGIEFLVKDISLSARILAAFNQRLPENQRVEDALSTLGGLAKESDTTIIKLPNISASIPQLKAVIKELQEKGFNLPDYPDTVNSEDEKEIKVLYDKVKGSAVNPVLREGNSDRRAPLAVKNYAKKHPHSMGTWSSESMSHVSTMSKGDFKSNEKSITSEKATQVTIEFISKEGASSLLKKDIAIQEGEIFDTTKMSVSQLRTFLKDEINDATSKGLLLSAHLKATMMKVSDPILFGHIIEIYFEEVFEKYQDIFSEQGINANEGLQSIFNKLEEMADSDLAKEIKASFDKVMEDKADLAMVNSDKGITNLHIPSDVIIDASMPAMIRNSGQMWDKNGQSRDTKALIPDSSYAAVYQSTIDYCKENGAFDPREMGTVPNIGLMAQKAEEYGSHDKTFELSEAGVVRVVDKGGEVLQEQSVEEGDIFRMCQVKDAPIRNWVSLAVERASLSNTPAVFWLDSDRAHDRELIKKVEAYLSKEDTTGLDLRILSPKEATLFTLDRLKKGLDTISVTGNVLRDYLTDLFPILEVGTSAKMLSIVPLMNGGGLFETGAGGSAPKHVEQFIEEGHLRWDSLGEFLALQVALEFVGQQNQSKEIQVYSDTLGAAVEKLLDQDKGPKRKAGELDTRGSHFYLIKFWIEALAQSNLNDKVKFENLNAAIDSLSDQILGEINTTQGQPQDLGGYYTLDASKATKAMCPSKTLNSLLEEHLA